MESAHLEAPTTGQGESVAQSHEELVSTSPVGQKIRKETEQQAGETGQQAQGEWVERVIPTFPSCPPSTAGPMLIIKPEFTLENHRV